MPSNQSVLVAFFAAAALTVVPDTSDAKSFRVAQLPNGSTFSCDTCHEVGNTGYVNPFGVGVLSALAQGGDVKWAELYDKDADGDGYTNGFELGDPDGTWRIGDPAPSGKVSHPGIKEDSPCDDGTLDPGEECDGTDYDGATCAMAGFIGGTIACTNCRIDTYECSNCGNDVADPEEPCDGDDLKSADCTSFGFDSGTLACSTLCTLDISECVGSPTPVCGDGVRVPTEECEGKDLGPRSCASLGWSGGILKCADNCTFDTSACFGPPPNNDTSPTPTTQIPTTSEPDTSDDDAGGCATVSDWRSSALSLVVLGFVLLRRRTGNDR